ncbi:MAG: GNAT family N-acetyltransferase [Paenibacillaceae bacterium]|uniref:GNAT family N-acetyltransferase n=1 Tax=Paenibacillus mellifer TaxID=2937794 RepID=A0A9X1Y0N7_9BACL|nr:GNAT family N-acetyltransferase [Paenibacillus mellifer]MBW4841708.1 GNAT family N-acetyltransferase [Paenibacillaceae bacterium]MCK8489385.1 GNAT family N-acetyltransferase [Paenibacillus mellifer]
MQWTFNTLTEWDRACWDKLGPIYREAFPHGAKPEKVLRSMLDRRIASLHAGLLEGEPVAMAITGFNGGQGVKRFILDYMAVRQDLRGQGLGRLFFSQIRDFADQDPQAEAILIEAEAEDTEMNRERLRFWLHCGFIATPYVHQYIWVPEPYRALYLPLKDDFTLTDDGKTLFRDITSFHHQSFRGQ